LLDLWTKYTFDNINNSYRDISKFIWYNCLGLGCKRILDVGCNIGMELVSFPNYADLTGVDSNLLALKKAEQRLPYFKFKQGNITNLDIPDNSYDMVFDRGVMIHLDDNEVDIAMHEMFRVSRKYVMNLEYLGEDGKRIEWRGGEPLFYRDMINRWKDYNVNIISDVKIPYDIDSNRLHYTLVRKNES